jgi:hypothetical protein
MPHGLTYQLNRSKAVGRYQMQIWANPFASMMEGAEKRIRTLRSRTQKTTLMTGRTRLLGHP